MRRTVIGLVGCAVALAACGSGSSSGRTETAASTAATTRSPSDGAAGVLTTVATGLRVPWGVAFLPSGDALVAERGGRIVRIARRSHRVRTAMRVPGVVQEGEGGLLGLAVSPDYRRDRLIYAYLTTARDNRIVRFRLGGRPRVVLSGLPKGVTHNGGRIAFGPDGKLYAGVGDSGEAELAQERGALGGKILRMNPGGGVPRGNPFRGSRVWSWGHRNVQGLAWDRAGRLWATEFGQNDVDEVNLIRRGRNYGWPVVEGRGSTHGGRFVNPRVAWSTDEASPSGAAIVGGTLYVGALRGQRLWAVPLRGTATGTPRAFLDGRLGRIRTVVAAPDGSLWLTTSNRDGRGQARSGDDRVLRWVPPR